MLVNFAINAQGTVKNKEHKTIPIIDYKANADFNDLIRSAFFINPYSDYLLISKDSSEIRSIDLIFGTKHCKPLNIDSPFNNLIPQSTLELDSVFFLNFNNDYKFVNWTYHIYGQIKNNQIKFYKGVNNIGLSFQELIESEFSSIDSFKAFSQEKAYNEINYNIYNGIYPLDTKNAITFLKNSYSFYADCYNDNTSQIAKKLISFIHQSIKLNDIQSIEIEQLLKNCIINKHEFNINRYDPDWYKSKHLYLCGISDYTDCIKSSLSDDQLFQLRQKTQQEAYLRTQYYLYLVRTERDNRSVDNWNFYDDVKRFAIIKDVVENN
ncbi:hypothetical protein [Carboxylicivirga sp. N1Y90]|uniref:hypothetical protein n=1 Tax=Carboxylicivirga fragile TaxID=3417571 RepID=UPI003D33E9F9|nr:hypothetical protein [Marinilabiliaceae bacterium N1Y90]